jgi:hypothetical protein
MTMQMTKPVIEYKVTTDESRFDIWRRYTTGLIIVAFMAVVIFAFGVMVGLGL